MIKVQQLTKSYGKQQVLKGISTSVNKGEVVAIIGPSGSGKSTFLRCLNLLEVPTSGTILIGDQELTSPKADVASIRQHIGMVFQHFHLFPHMTVLENITFAPTQVKGISQEEAKRKAMELLTKVGLADKADSYPSKLSGGQKQRVAIARSLAMEPEIMLFDEPTSALDPEMVKEVLNVIKDLADSGMTMLIVTHEMKFAREAADTIYFLDQGQLIESATPDQFFTNPQSERAIRFLEQVL
ncbi:MULTISPECIES: amino acid ABC transporter ATP-binding protein [Paenibacillus]|uniref:amino acid ABC transporter ATP-binding protein n=1 Tax=Paenibacillus TaxID=44249 RepID=UPI002040568D|nr:amino acid ABC transporter ATP-binding protein [Paenibacillus camelliae]